MLKLIRNAFLGSSLLLLGMAANAQVYHDRDDYYRGYGGNVVDQVRSDVQEAMNMGGFSWRDRNVMSSALEDLSTFDRQWDQGSFNRHELDEAVARLQIVANSGRISEEQRAMLQDDVNRLRQFRASNTTNGYFRNDQTFRNDQNTGRGYYDRYGNWHPYR